MIRFIERFVGNNPRITITADSIKHLLQIPYMKMKWGKSIDKLVFSDNGKVLYVVGLQSDLVGYWKYVMTDDGFYGRVVVSNHTFDQIDEKYLISHSDETIKYLCANEPEERHLNNLNIDCSVTCDWFKIVREKEGE